GGFFFNATDRQGEFDEDDPNPADNTEEFTLLSDDDLSRLAAHAREARSHGRAVMATPPGTSFGDVSNVPAMFLKHPKGIRDVAEWYISVAARQDFIHEVFSKQADVAVENLKRILAAVGNDAYDVVYVCGTDFGTQISTFCSKETFIELYQPYYRRVNDWIHENTTWKTFKHSCGAIEPFIDPLIESGFDILNPVQCAATGMDPQLLKDKYGDRIVFWGGGVDTQQTLPFGTPEEVKREALERCKIFAPGGGFVFNTIHNTQALTPTANFIALLDAYKEFNSAGK
ncbi:MAG: methyltransferase, partial [Planctomycetes bacterium]|nr:methyltransferase [Planctomycetota bacterium]